MKRLLLLSDFNQNQNVYKNLFKNIAIIRVAGVALFCADFRETEDKHDKAESLHATAFRTRLKNTIGMNLT